MSAIKKFYLTDSDEERTFKFDEALPSLPVPDLDQTLKRYLKSIVPFVSESEYNKTKDVVDEFRNGVGKSLQAKLIARSSKMKNWLDDWWLKYTYLSIREPIAPLLNMSGVQSLNYTIWQPREKTAIKEGALALWVNLDFYTNLRKEKLRPQISKKGKRLNMNQYRFLYNTSRIPNEGFDRIENYFKTEREGRCPQHLIVICLGHIWFFDPWISESECITAPEIEDQLKYIKRLSESLGQGQEVGILTFDDRETWAKNRRWLMSVCEENADHIRLIESAVLVYSLDEYSPSSISDACQVGLCGNPANRWADKSYSAITYKNGYHCTSNDHSPCDAMVGVTVGHYQHEIITRELKGSWQGTKHIRLLQRPRRLVFQLDDLLTSSISRVSHLNKALRESISVKFMEFSLYGKNWIKEGKVHPDAFLQSSLQLAYYILHRKFAPTYETATTRQFYRARTETVRSCTSEMTDFVLAMISSTASAKEKKEKLRKAALHHLNQLTECENAQGIDRHLMGLAIIANENGLPIPDLFSDPSFKRSGGGGNFVLSTSTVGYTYVLGGVAAMVQDGYGIFYAILPNSIHFFLSCFNSGDTCLQKFSDALTHSLTLMYQVMNDGDEPTNKL